MIFYLLRYSQGCINGTAMEHCPGQTDAEYRTEFSMWSIAASSLIVATDIRNMTDIMKEVERESVDINTTILNFKIFSIIDTAE